MAKPLSLILQIQPLNLLLRLRLHDSIPCGPKIRHLYAHSSFPQRHQSGFGANSFDVSAREVIFLADEFIEFDVVAKGHLGGVQVEDFALGVF